MAKIPEELLKYISEEVLIILTLPDPPPDSIDRVVRVAIAARLIANVSNFIDDQAVQMQVKKAVAPLVERRFQEQVLETVQKQTDVRAQSKPEVISEWDAIAMYLASRRHGYLYQTHSTASKT